MKFIFNDCKAFTIVLDDNAEQELLERHFHHDCHSEKK